MLMQRGVAMVGQWLSVGRVPLLRTYGPMKALHGERKRKVHVTMTPTAMSRLDEIAFNAQLSRSEALERLIRSTPPYEGLVLAQFSE